MLLIEPVANRSFERLFALGVVVLDLVEFGRPNGL